MDLQTRADRLAQLMQDRLDVSGHGLEAKLGRAGRRLPRHLRDELEYVVLALRMEETPRLAPQIDWDRIVRGTDLVERYLKDVDPWARRRTLLLDWLAGNLANLLIVAGIVLALMAWRGLL